MTTHKIIERDAAFVEFTSKYNAETEMLEHTATKVGDSISGFDTEYRCSCGKEFPTYEAAKTHVKDETKKTDT